MLASDKCPRNSKCKEQVVDFAFILYARAFLKFTTCTPQFSYYDLNACQSRYLHLVHQYLWRWAMPDIGRSQDFRTPPVSRFPKAYKVPYTSRLALFAWLSMKRLRGATSSPISMLKILSASTASSTETCRMVRCSGSMVVSQRVSGFISPRPL